MGEEPRQVLLATTRLKKQAIMVKGNFVNRQAFYIFSALVSDSTEECGINHGRIVRLKVSRVYPRRGKVEVARFRKFWYTFSKPSGVTLSKIDKYNLGLLVKRLECYPTSANMGSGFKITQFILNKIALYKQHKIKNR